MTLHSHKAGATRICVLFRRTLLKFTLPLLLLLLFEITSKSVSYDRQDFFRVWIPRVLYFLVEFYIAVTVLERELKEIASENLVRHDDIKKSMNFRELIKANFISVFGYVTFVGETPSSAILLLKSFSVTKEFSMLPPIFNFQTPQKYPFWLKWGGRISKWAMFSFYFKATKVFYQIHEISWPIKLGFKHSFRRLKIRAIIRVFVLLEQVI